MVNGENTVKKTVVTEAQKERAKDMLKGLSEEEIAAVLTTLESKSIILELLRRIEEYEQALADIRKRLILEV